jgi:hypothetical protein
MLEPKRSTPEKHRWQEGISGLFPNVALFAASRPVALLGFIPGKEITLGNNVPKIALLF